MSVLKEGPLFLISVWLSAFCGCGLETYYFVSQVQPFFNFSTAQTICENLTNGEIASADNLDTQQFLGNCSETLNANGNFWIKTFEANLFPNEPTSWLCDFESEDSCFLSFISTNGYSWIREKGSTPSGSTGPDGAYLGEYYIYLEANPVPEGQNFIVESISLAGQDDTPLCLVFHYHMYGDGMGRLSIKLLSEGTKTLWTREGEQGDEWLLGCAEIASENRESVIQIIGQRGSNKRGDIALDNIRLKYGTCNIYTEFQDIGCGDVRYSEDGIITSPNYPNNYPDNANCKWIIKVPQGYRIQLQVIDFSLESQVDDRCYDNLEITESNGNAILGTTCTRPTTNIIQTNASEVVIKFKSDNSLRFKGFNISWSSEKVYCPSARISNGTLHSVQIPCTDVLDNVVCFVSDGNNSKTECRQFYTYQTTEATTANSPSHASSDKTTEANITYRPLHVLVSKDVPLPTEAIAGGTVGLFLVVALVVGIAAFYKIRNKKKKNGEEKFHQSFRNPEYMESTTTTIIDEGTSSTSPVAEGVHVYSAMQNGVSTEVHAPNTILREEQAKPTTISKSTEEISNEKTYENTIVNNDNDIYNHLHDQANDGLKNPAFEAPSYDHIPTFSHNADRSSHIYDHTVREGTEGKNENNLEDTTEDEYMNI